jgi:hypothetical protein
LITETGSANKNGLKPAHVCLIPVRRSRQGGARRFFLPDLLYNLELYPIFCDFLTGGAGNRQARD